MESRRCYAVTCGRLLGPKIKDLLMGLLVFVLERSKYITSSSLVLLSIRNPIVFWMNTIHNKHFVAFPNLSDLPVTTYDTLTSSSHVCMHYGRLKISPVLLTSSGMIITYLSLQVLMSHDVGRTCDSIALNAGADGRFLT